MRVELLYFEDCPNWKTADRRLRALASDRGLEVEHRLVNTVEEAEKAGFQGSPTILIDGCDPFARSDEPLGLSCRLYRTPEGSSGSPTGDQLRSILDA
jgi:hypothetical protein